MYTVVMAGDMHCVHLSYLLGPVSAPLLSVMSVGTLWRWLETCTVCTYPIYLDWCPLHFSQCCWLQVHCGEGWRLNPWTEDLYQQCPPPITSYSAIGFDWWLMIAYIALFSALLSRLTALACDSTWVTSILLRVFLISTEVVYLRAGMAGATWNCCCLGAGSVYTIQPCSMSLHAKLHT